MKTTFKPELRHVKKKSHCKGCHKTLDTEKKGGEKVVVFYAGGSRGMYVHICMDCVFTMLDTFAEEHTPEVVEDSE